MTERHQEFVHGNYDQFVHATNTVTGMRERISDVLPSLENLERVLSDVRKIAEPVIDELVDPFVKSRRLIGADDALTRISAFVELPSAAQAALAAGNVKECIGMIHDALPVLEQFEGSGREGDCRSQTVSVTLASTALDLRGVMDDACATVTGLLDALMDACSSKFCEQSFLEVVDYLILLSLVDEAAFVEKSSELWQLCAAAVERALVCAEGGCCKKALACALDLVRKVLDVVDRVVNSRSLCRVDVEDELAVCFLEPTKASVVKKMCTVLAVTCESGVIQLADDVQQLIIDMCVAFDMFSDHDLAISAIYDVGQCLGERAIESGIKYVQAVAAAAVDVCWHSLSPDNSWGQSTDVPDGASNDICGILAEQLSRVDAPSSFIVNESSRFIASMLKKLVESTLAMVGAICDGCEASGLLVDRLLEGVCKTTFAAFAPTQTAACVALRTITDIYDRSERGGLQFVVSARAITHLLTTESSEEGLLDIASAHLESRPCGKSLLVGLDKSCFSLLEDGSALYYMWLSGEVDKLCRRIEYCLLSGDDIVATCQSVVGIGAPQRPCIPFLALVVASATCYQEHCSSLSELLSGGVPDGFVDELAHTEDLLTRVAEKLRGVGVVSEAETGRYEGDFLFDYASSVGSFMQQLPDMSLTTKTVVSIVTTGNLARTSGASVVSSLLRFAFFRVGYSLSTAMYHPSLSAHVATQGQLHDPVTAYVIIHATACSMCGDDRTALESLFDVFCKTISQTRPAHDDITDTCNVADILQQVEAVLPDGAKKWDGY